MMNAAFLSQQKKVIERDVQHYLENVLPSLISPPDNEVCEYIDEIYPPVVVAGCTYEVSTILKNVDETVFKLMQDNYEEEIANRIKEAACEVIDNENGEVLDDYCPHHLQNLLQQYVGVCSNLYRCDN